MTASGIGWLTQNSGDIVRAYNAIKCIVGMEDDEMLKDGENLVPRLRRAMDANEKAMKAISRALLKLPADGEYGESLGNDDQRSAIMELTGILNSGQ